jgi:hypothetical protein
MHSGFELVPALIKCFGIDIPIVGDFLDSRLIMSPHLDCASLNRKALRKTLTSYPSDPTDKKYIHMIGDPWQDKNKLKASMFDDTEFEKTIKVMYFDIPKLHEFSKEGDKFFSYLFETGNIEIFAK